MLISRSAFLATCLSLVLLSASACEAPTEAPRRSYVDIFDIAIPSALLATDTLRIAFRYGIQCGPLPAVDVQIRNAAVNVAVWYDDTRENIVCPGIFVSARTEIILPPEARAAGTTEVRFRQSSGPDSVRVVSTLSASASAP